MDLVLTTAAADGVTLLTAMGEIDLATIPRLHEGILRAADLTAGAVIVLDLDGVGSCDPYGVGALVAARSHVRARGGDVWLVCSGGACAAALAASGLTDSFRVIRSVTDAMEATRGRP